MFPLAGDKKVNRNINVKEQELPTFNKVGFIAA